MNLKVCPNPKCTFHGRVHYTPQTRCRLCGWDLQPTRQKSETARRPEAPAQVLSA